MRITKIDCRLVQVPMARPRASKAEVGAGRQNHVSVLLVNMITDCKLQGLGFAYTLQGSGRAMLVTAQEDLAPLLLDEDPLDHLRLEAKVYWKLQTIGRSGLVQQAYSAFDVALWDIKGKVANLPLYKLLGGARPACPAYGSDTAWLWMSVGEIMEASQPYLEQGLMGIKVKVGSDPESDAERLTNLREAWGDQVWIGVDANQRYDYPTALAMGHFFEEEVGIDWFEEPIHCEDLKGHSRLSSNLEIALAGGETLFTLAEFQAYLDQNALAVIQPDITRIGGITPFLKVASLCDLAKRPISPHLLPEIAVHLACGIPGVQSVEFMPWLFPLFQNPPRIESGQLVPPPGPGLGLELNSEAVTRFQVQ